MMPTFASTNRTTIRTSPRLPQSLWSAVGFISLSSVTGAYWQTQEQIFVSGSLALFNQGHALIPAIDYLEQYPSSGTFQYISTPPTGTYNLAIYGVPVAGGGGGGSSSSGALVLLEQHTASNSATLDFITCISTLYDTYAIEIINIVPASNAVNFLLTFSSNGGSSWIATNYNWSYTYLLAGGAATGIVNGSSDSSIHLSNANSSTASQGSISGNAQLYNPGSSLYKELLYRVLQQNSGDGNFYKYEGGSYYAATTAINALRFAFSSGNISSGTIRIYGVAKS